MKKRALFSVSDKTGVCEFARRTAALGYEIVSTGGTQKTLEEAGIPVVNVSAVTGFPECLDGRLKTLHPAIHGGILAMRGSADHMAQMELLNIEMIDIVVINLYPFKQTILREGVRLDEAIENIDIGGPTLIRAAAKNWPDVVVAVDPGDYAGILEMLENGGVPREKRFALACKVFEHTAHYDALIADYLRREAGVVYPETLTLTYERAQDLRYGENPHQSAAFYREIGRLEGSLAKAEQLHGKEMSFNNINDAAAAVGLIKEFDRPCAVAVKHANPCGVAVADTLAEAFRKAYEADPVSIYGGIVALNRLCEVDTAEEMTKVSFLEIIIAPGYTDEALELLTRKKNVRILLLEDICAPLPKGALDFKKIQGGLLVQEADCLSLDSAAVKLATKREPTPDELETLEFAWKVCKHVKSNAIVLAKDGMTVGIGPGQVNRIMPTEIAIRFAGERAKGSVMASDAYFPFSDCVEAAGAAGIAAIMQPGGSIRDQESIDAADSFDIAMVFTGERHFKH
ncbi:MAG: bifunctional phosphoribosylaminoimidazolecarboxamide formyltransferase/IMP cyclohydrolase [Oscillospiraceae bacterium]|jgi:phosphoribosylaminoimidazolecarboxamide formyltransferase/IMP cyclohydrolase|nr:bifunctional phosphoribosylaminoimidazolecarboxamide formyltransferase/IMP cyclohydrolase [Oscillospiraceae bacterium]